jgi:hypothetical protein
VTVTRPHSPPLFGARARVVARAGEVRSSLPLVVFAAAVFATFVALCFHVDNPRLYVDEVRYLDAASSLAHGHGLQVRGGGYGWAPGYPVVVAPLVALASGRVSAYAWVKVANAFFFALAAIPIYLLARRFVSRRLSTAVALLSIVIPSSVYVSLVLTESLAYLVASVALYAIVLALEGPTTRRQLCALASVALAYAVRPQFAALYVLYIIALAVLLPAPRRTRLRDVLPSLLSIGVLFVGLLVVLLTRGASALGRYSDLWRAYHPISVARWFVYYSADLALYVGLVPVVVAPAVVLLLRARHRAGSRRHAVLLVVFLGANLLTLAVAAAFASTPYAMGLLHDRYVFYVVPLWLVAGAVWLQESAPRPRGALAVGAATLLLLVAAFPFARFITDDGWRQLHATATPLWAHVAAWSVPHGVSGHRAVGFAAVAVVVLVVLVPHRMLWAAAAIPVAAVLVVNTVLLWDHALEDSNRDVFGAQSRTTLAWIDHVVPAGQSVTMLSIPAAACGRFGEAYGQTEFFNDRVGPVSSLGPPPPNGLPSKVVHVRSDGLVVRRGHPISARWLVLPPGVVVRGSRAAEGTRQRLTLWRVRAPVSVDAHSDRQLVHEACGGL